MNRSSDIAGIILLIICIISLAITINQLVRNKNSFYIRLIVLYIFLTVFQLSLGAYITTFSAPPNSNKASIVNISVYIYIIFEYIILSFLISNFIVSEFIKKIIKLSCILFPAIAIFNWFYFDSFIIALSISNTMEGILLIISSLYFFQELIRTPIIPQLEKDPSFWIVIGILFLFICITPYYLSFEYFKAIPQMQIIDYVAYLIIIVLFTKASLCKPIFRK